MPMGKAQLTSRFPSPLLCFDHLYRLAAQSSGVSFAGDDHIETLFPTPEHPSWPRSIWLSAGSPHAGVVLVLAQRFT